MLWFFKVSLKTPNNGIFLEAEIHMEIKGVLPVPLGNTDIAKQDFFPLKINIYSYILQYITENSSVVCLAAGAAKMKLANPKILCVRVNFWWCT